MKMKRTNAAARTIPAAAEEQLLVVIPIRIQKRCHCFIEEVLLSVAAGLKKGCEAVGFSRYRVVEKVPHHALEITADELRDLLADCSPAERMGIMRVAQETKKALKSKNHES